MERCYEDFTPGMIFRSGTIRVDAESIKRFAAQYDPQPFHLDEDAANQSFFKGLVASGWHTASLTMRLIVESDLKPAGGVIGAGVEEIRWPRAVRPGDELHATIEIIEVRPSKSRPEQGLVKVLITTINQSGETVETNLANLVVPRRTRA